MNKHLQIAVLILTFVSGSAGQASTITYNPQVLAVVAKDQLDRIDPSLRALVCLSLPNHEDPKPSSLKMINGETLHLQSGTKCWKPPQGTLLLIKDYKRLDSRSVAIVVELDDMNLDGAHVVTRVREDTYKLKLEGRDWKIESLKSKSF